MHEKLPQIYEPGRMSVQRHFVLLGSLATGPVHFLGAEEFFFLQLGPDCCADVAGIGRVCISLVHLLCL